MPYSGDGEFTLTYNWVQDAAAGIYILASRMQTQEDDIAANGLSNCITRDGQSPPTTDIPMGGFKLTGLANGSAATDAVALGQLQTPGSLALFATGLTVSTSGITIQAGGLAVIGASTFSSTMVVSGAGTFLSTFQVNSVATFNAVATFAGNCSFAGSITAGGVIDVQGNTSSSQSGFQYSPSGAVAFGPGTIGYGLVASGRNLLASNYFAASDGRLKFDVETINDDAALAWLTRSRPVRYRKRQFFGSPDEDAVTEAGFIAQEQMRAGASAFIYPASSPGMPEMDEPDMKLAADHMLALSPGYQIAFLTAALKITRAELQSALTRIERLEQRS